MKIYIFKYCGKAYATKKKLKAFGSVDFVATKFLDGLSPLALLGEFAHGQLLGLGLASLPDAPVDVVVVSVGLLLAFLDTIAKFLLFGFAVSTIAAALNNHLEAYPFVGLAAAFAVPIAASLDLNRSRRAALLPVEMAAVQSCSRLACRQRRRFC